MTETLENDRLTVRVDRHGAEIVSVRDPQDIEFIWQADPAVWKRHAPILFPIVGRLHNDRLRIGDREYTMTQHGFARDSVFDLVDRGECGLALELRDSPATRETFPFAFALRVEYRLDGNRLGVAYTVTNPADNALHFSIGAHPAFACPIGCDGGEFSDYVLAFNRRETATRWRLEDGLVAETEERFLDDQDVLGLSEDLFAADALVFKGLSSDTIRLESPRSPHRVTMECPGFPYLGIWSKPGAPFVCIEPWHGIADAQGFDGPFEEKEGVIGLDPKVSFRIGYTLIFE